MRDRRLRRGGRKLRPKGEGFFKAARLCRLRWLTHVLHRGRDAVRLGGYTVRVGRRTVAPKERVPDAGADRGRRCRGGGPHPGRATRRPGPDREGLDHRGLHRHPPVSTRWCSALRRRPAHGPVPAYGCRADGRGGRRMWDVLPARGIRMAPQRRHVGGQRRRPRRGAAFCPPPRAGEREPKGGEPHRRFSARRERVSDHPDRVDRSACPVVGMVRAVRSVTG